MGEQLEFGHVLEKKDEVFYVRCRPKIKQALLLRMQKDGFNSMADWFEQFVKQALTTKKAVKNDRKKRKLQKRN
jgi:hypothetical protein